jgi:hypothetical protein
VRSTVSSLPVVADENAPVLVDLEPVRPAVVLRDEFPVFFRRDAENAAERNIDEPQVAFAIERRTLEKTFDFGALSIGIRPRGARLLAEFRRHRHENFGLDHLQRLKWVEHGRPE